MFVVIATPDTPTWEVEEDHDGRIEIVVAKPKEGQE